MSKHEIRSDLIFKSPILVFQDRTGRSKERNEKKKKLRWRFSISLNEGTLMSARLGSYRKAKQTGYDKKEPKWF